MKDNFSNSNPFGRNKSKYSEHLENYIGMVNQPTAADAFGDAFSQAGSAPAVGAQAHEANALLSGIGAGIKGAANSQRQEKLSPIMQLTAQIVAKEAELTAQMQEEEGRKMTGIQFINSNLSLIDSLGNSTTAGDVPSATGQARTLGDAFQKAFGIKLGEFDSYDLNTRRAYYKNEDGTVTGYNIADEIREYAQAALGDKAAFVMQKLDPYFKTQYQNTEEMRRLQEEAIKAGIADKYSQANYNNARTDGVKQEMNAPKPKYSEHIQNSLTQENHKWINSLRDEHAKLTKQANAYEQIGNLIAQESSKFGRGGTGLIAMAQRAVNKSGTESEKNQALIELYKQPLMSGIKEMFAGSTSDFDVANFVAGLPSLDKNPDAAIQVAKERAAEIRLKIESDNHTRDVLENEFGYSEPYNSLAVQNKVKERLGGNLNKEDDANDMVNSNQQQGMVQMQAPDGSIRAVPMDQAEKWKSRGATIVNE